MTPIARPRGRAPIANGLLERPRDGDFHLLDRHHAVVDADDDAGKFVVGKTATGSVSASYTPTTARMQIRKMIEVEWRANQ